MALAGDTAIVTREVDGRLQVIKVALPANVSVDLRLNEPGYARLPNIKKAKAKPLTSNTPADYGVDATPRLQMLRTVGPTVGKAGVKLTSVDMVIAKLKDEARVL